MSPVFLQLLVNGPRHAFVCALSRYTVGSVARAFFGSLAQERHLCFTIGHRIMRKLVTEIFEREGKPVR
jgi:hypothetical protein